MSKTGLAWSDAPVSSIGSSSSAFDVRAASKARSVFVRRALRRVAQLAVPEERPSILVLGGTGGEAFELVESCGGGIELDVEVVSLDLDESLLPEVAAFPIDAPGRLSLIRGSPIAELLEGSATTRGRHDLVVIDSLLDGCGEREARAVIEATFARLRPGGIGWGAMFTEPLVSDPSRRGMLDVAAWSRVIVERGGSLRLLDRGPNLWIGVARSARLHGIEE